MNAKNSILAVVISVTSLMHLSAYAGNQARESVCLRIGKYAASVADARDQGRSETEAMGLLTRAKKGTPEGDLYVALQQVVTWVYTVQLPAPDARKQVYTKCLNREFFAYNPKLDG